MLLDTGFDHHQMMESWCHTFFLMRNIITTPKKNCGSIRLPDLSRFRFARCDFERYVTLVTRDMTKIKGAQFSENRPSAGTIPGHLDHRRLQNRIFENLRVCLERFEVSSLTLVT